MKGNDNTFERTAQAAGAHGWMSHPRREFIDASYMLDSLRYGATRRRIIAQAALLPSTRPFGDLHPSQVSL